MERQKKKLEFDAIQEPRVTRCRMLRMYPTPRQHAWLMRWFRDTRTTYNLAMGRILERKLHHLQPEQLHLGELEKELQSKLVTANGVKEHLASRHHKLLRTPKVLRQQAVKATLAVLKAHHTRMTKQEKLHKQYPNARAFTLPLKFNPGLKSKQIKFASDSFSVESRSLHVTSDDTISLFKNIKHQKDGKYLFRSIRTQKGMLKLSTAQDFKVHYRHGKIYLILPERQCHSASACIDWWRGYCGYRSRCPHRLHGLLTRRLHSGAGYQHTRCTG